MGRRRGAPLGVVGAVRVAQGEGLGGGRRRAGARARGLGLRDPVDGHGAPAPAAPAPDVTEEQVVATAGNLAEGEILPVAGVRPGNRDGPERSPAPVEREDPGRVAGVVVGPEDPGVACGSGPGRRSRAGPARRGSGLAPGPGRAQAPGRGGRAQAAHRGRRRGLHRGDPGGPDDRGAHRHQHRDDRVARSAQSPPRLGASPAPPAPPRVRRAPFGVDFHLSGRSCSLIVRPGDPWRPCWGRPSWGWAVSRGGEFRRWNPSEPSTRLGASDVVGGVNEPWPSPRTTRSW